MTDEVLLKVANLTVEFKDTESKLIAVRDVSFDVARGEIVGIIGESGCGKSLTGRAILGLLPAEAILASGTISFEGRNLTQISEREFNAIRGTAIASVFQDPLASLNPLMQVGRQITEGMNLRSRKKKKTTASDAVRIAEETLSKMGFSNPKELMAKYPHELSGGMRQRAMLASAFTTKPSLLIADEPTTALDVTIQKQVVSEMVEMARQFRTSVILISHDMAVVSNVADRMICMYAGEIVEIGPVDDFVQGPLHPYARALRNCAVPIDQAARRLPTVPGRVPKVGATPTACVFRHRCPIAQPRCSRSHPDLSPHGARRFVRCFFPVTEKAT